MDGDMKRDGKEPGSKEMEEKGKRWKFVSPTTRFMQSNEFRSEIPTDQNRLRSPNGLLRKKYMTSFRKENLPEA